MLRIDCPWCGPRDEVEFRFGGEVPVVRPGLDCSDAEWADYLFARANPRGASEERGLHLHGCHRWLTLRRDTLIHRPMAQRAINAPVPPAGPTAD